MERVNDRILRSFIIHGDTPMLKNRPIDHIKFEESRSMRIHMWLWVFYKITNLPPVQDRRSIHITGEDGSSLLKLLLQKIYEMSGAGVAPFPNLAERPPTQQPSRTVLGVPHTLRVFRKVFARSTKIVKTNVSTVSTDNTVLRSLHSTWFRVAAAVQRTTRGTVE